MFIIFAPPWSGTTFLKEALGANPSIVIPHETDFIIPLGFVLDRIKDGSAGKSIISGIIRSSAGFAASIGRFLDAEEVDEIVAMAPYSLAGILGAIYDALAKKQGAVIAGDNSPNDLSHFGILAAAGLFESDIKIIHLVRDARDVMPSLRKTSWAPADKSDTAETWSLFNRNLKKMGSKRPSHYRFLRFEDLIMAPRENLTCLCAFLGVDYTDSMLSWDQMGRDPRHLDHLGNLGKPPQEDRRLAWKTTGTSNGIFEWAARASDALREFGYEPITDYRQSHV